MGFIHGMVARAKSGLKGIQASQRDWSPFLVHFTQYGAMEGVRRLSLAACTAKDVAQQLREADEQSFKTVKTIFSSGRLLARSPSDKDGLPKCVCLSECNISGLIGHAERYGRFGFVFRKDRLFREGGRPCAYLSTDEYARLSDLYQANPDDPATKRLHGLANVYTPPGEGRVQDYTHEREWRIFDDISFSGVPPVLYLAPFEYCADVQTLAGQSRVVIPLDLLFEWGA
jgi:hypothetical protein